MIEILLVSLEQCDYMHNLFESMCEISVCVCVKLNYSRVHMKLYY